MLGCKGILRFPGFSSLGETSVSSAPVLVFESSRHGQWRSYLLRSPRRRTVLSLCNDDGLHTEKKVKRTRRRSKPVAAEEAALGSTASPVLVKLEDATVDDAADGFLRPASITVPVGNREVI